jgi:hypothetical protein
VHKLLPLLSAKAVSVSLFSPLCCHRVSDDHHHHFVPFSCLKLLSRSGCFLGTTPAPQATSSKIRMRSWLRPAVILREIASAVTTLPAKEMNLEALFALTLYKIISDGEDHYGGSEIGRHFGS